MKRNDEMLREGMLDDTLRISTPTQVSPLPTQVSPLPTQVSPLPTQVSPLPTQVSPLPVQLLQIPSLTSTAETYLNKITLVMGGRCCGKTTFVINEIYQKIMNSIDNVFVVTNDKSNEYMKITNKTYTSKNLSDICYGLMKDTGRSRKLLIIDDAVDTFEKIESFLELFYNTKHHDTTMIITCQGDNLLKPALRQQLSNCFVRANGHNISEIKRIREHYFGMISHVEILKKVFSDLEPFCFLGVTNDELVVCTAHVSDDITYRKIENSIVLEKKIIQDDIDATIISLTKNIEELIAIRNGLKSLRKD
jgi:hypothetical protein